MTITAESNSSSAVRSCIGIRVAGKADRTFCIVPYSVFIVHETRFVCLRMGAFDTVIIEMAPDTDRIAAFCIVAGLALFDILPGKVSV